MEIEIWSDVVCPWCYIGKRRFEAALSSFEHADEVSLRWRAFELNPSAPRVSDITVDQMLARKYGVSAAEVATMQERVTRLAAAEGLGYRLDLAKPTNSFDAHRLVAFAATTGHQDALVEALFEAYFTRGANIADHDTLVAIATGVGLAANDVTEVIDGDAFGAEVRDDEAKASELRITGVPFFVFDRKLAVGGAQDLQVFTRALTEAQALAG